MPENPFKPKAATIDLPVEPAWTVTTVGTAESVKFCARTLAPTYIVWTGVPLELVAVTRT